MGGVKKEKAALRRELLARRDALPGRAEKSRAIQSRVLALPEYQRARRVLLYLSKGSEVDTWPLLDGALAQLRADIAEELTSAVDSLEVVLDRDGRREVRLLLQVEVSPGELEDDPAPAALHDGDFHIHHHAPALDDLRDRVAAPAPSPLRRVLGRMRESLAHRRA